MLSEEALAAEGIALLRRSGSTEKRRPPVAARGGGAGAIKDQVGRKARRGQGGVAAVREGAESSAPFAMLGEEQGTGTRCRRIVPICTIPCSFQLK